MLKKSAVWRADVACRSSPGRRCLFSGWLQRGCGDQLGELAQVLGGGGEEELVFGPVRTSKAQPVQITTSPGARVGASTCSA